MDGEIAQDMGAQSADYPLTFYFDGPDNDLDARRFGKSVSERGVWRVIHPVLGILVLQPVKITIAVKPVESGNVTEISGDWWEPAEPDAASPDAAAALRSALYETSEAARKDAENRIDAKTPGGIQQALGQLKTCLQSVKKVLKTTTDLVLGIENTINGFITAARLEVASIAGAVIFLCQAPGLILGNLAARVSDFVKLGRRILRDLPEAIGFSLDKINAALTGELWLTAIHTGMGQAMLEKPPETRAEALSVLKQYRQFSRESRAALDKLAATTAGNIITEQYAPGSASTEALLRLRAAVARYLLTAAYSLNAERRIVLDRDTSPAKIVTGQMGAASGDYDEKYAALCRWNSLHGRELLLLNAGKELVLYE
jgi:hypothetical protein